jgi:hypothetical protein
VCVCFVILSHFLCQNLIKEMKDKLNMYSNSLHCLSEFSGLINEGRQLYYLGLNGATLVLRHKTMCD